MGPLPSTALLMQKWVMDERGKAQSRWQMAECQALGVRCQLEEGFLGALNPQPQPVILVTEG